MSEITFLVLLLFASYLAGSIPSSIIMGRFIRGIDIREHGSGNAGGTNVFRVLGWKPALVVLVVDGFKGWFSVAVLAPAFFNAQAIPDLGVVQILCGFAAVLGHTFTIFAGFKGGKGVGTLGGMLLALFPSAFLFCLTVGILTINSDIQSASSGSRCGQWHSSMTTPLSTLSRWTSKPHKRCT